MFAQRTPREAHGAATVCLSNLNEILRSSRTNTSDELPEAVAFPPVETLFPILARCKAFITFALVGSSCVQTTTVFAYVGVDCAFVNVLTIIGHADLLVSFRTDAHEAADQVLAHVLAIVGRGLALVNVLAVTAVCAQRVPIRANTPEGSLHVVTTEGALVSQLLTLVNIFTSLHRSWSITILTQTLEAALNVGTRPVSADIASCALIIINASSAGDVQNIALWTVAAERSVRVDTVSALAGTGHDHALVEVGAGLSSSRAGRA